jgi:DNA-binding PadR family transcriptional regulator
VPKGDHLGEFEQIVLIVLARLGGESYGVPIRREIERRTKRTVGVGAVYATLSRLEAKGLIESWVGDPTPERGGRRKNHVRLTAKGAAELNRSFKVWRGLWGGVSPSLLKGRA